jgi:outer membrane lipoprotein carrier protein
LRSKPYLTVSFLLVFSLMLVSEALPDDTLSIVMQGIRTRYGNAASMSAEYTREAISKTMALLGTADRKDIAQGKLFFKRPHFLRLEQKSPEEELLLTDGQTLWWHLPAKREAYRYPAEEFGHELRLLSDILTGLRNTSESFQFTLKAPTENNTYQLVLSPDPPRSDLAHINIIVLREDFTIRQIELHNKVGGLTRFILSDWQERAQFDPGFFSFSPPQGTKVIEQ